MTVADVEHIIEEWAPRWVAWERDNVGLQIGRRNQQVRKIMLALEVTEGVVHEAIRKKADLLFTHHPPLFHPASSLTDADQTGSNILTLAENKIAVYSAHTNLDFTRNGVSFALAETLGLKKAKFLSPLEGKLSKVVVFVPPTHVEQVAKKMSDSGAGVIGDYHSCSFRIDGTGTFEGTETSRPYIGRRQSFERVKEVRLEMIAPTARVPSVIQAIKNVHPYEEVAYDVYPVNTPSANYGVGAFGELDRVVTLQAFLRKCKQVLSVQSLRYTGNSTQKVRTAAVCGGSGSDLLEAAIRAKADVFVTADVRYHTFHAAHGRIALVDAGHWETEHVVLEPARRKLQDAARRLNQRISVTVAQTPTNPVQSL